jgi:hypothetical protein
LVEKTAPALTHAGEYANVGAIDENFARQRLHWSGNFFDCVIMPLTAVEDGCRSNDECLTASTLTDFSQASAGPENRRRQSFGRCWRCYKERLSGLRSA